jgi:HAMP domain-containing protein
MRRISSKLVLLVVAVAIIGSATVIVTLRDLKAQESAAGTAATNYDNAAVAQGIVADAVYYQREMSDAAAAAQSGDQALSSASLDKAATSADNIDSGLGYLGSGATGEARAQIDGSTSSWEELKRAEQQRLTAATNSGTAASRSRATKASAQEAIGAQGTLLEQQVSDLAQSYLIVGQDASGAIAEATAESRRVIVAAIGALILVTLSLGLWLYISSVPSLRRAENFAKRVAEGDPTASIGKHSSSEIGTMTRSVEEMKDTLVRRMDGMREMADVVWVVASDLTENSQAAEAAVDRLASVSDVPPDDLEAASHSVSEISRLSAQLFSLVDSLRTM